MVILILVHEHVRLHVTVSETAKGSVKELSTADNELHIHENGR